MSFCFGFLCNDAALLRTAQAPFRSDLTVEQGAASGWGLAYYQAAQPLLRKQPQAPDEGTLDFCDRAKNVRTNVLIGHVRSEATGGRTNDNTQPFRFRSWTFCHLGRLNGFDQIAGDMRTSIPDYMRRNIHGSTESEVLFHLFLAFLADADRLDDPRAPARAIARALRSALLYVDRLTTDRGGTPSSGCCLATNGRVLVAARSEIPLLVTRKASYLNVGQGPDDRPLSYPHLKAVVLVGGREPTSPGWELVAANAVVAVDSDLNIEHFAPEE